MRLNRPPADRMRKFLDDVLTDLPAYALAPFLGLAVGVAFGWPAGVAAGVGFVLLLRWLTGKAGQIIARSRESRVRQRRF